MGGAYHLINLLVPRSATSTQSTVSQYTCMNKGNYPLPFSLFASSRASLIE